MTMIVINYISSVLYASVSHTDIHEGKLLDMEGDETETKALGAWQAITAMGFG